MNNTFVRSAIIHGNRGAGPQFQADGTRRITNSLVNPQGTGTVSGTIGGDPRFVNPAAGDYRIRPDSPAYDTGTNLAWMGTATDLAGNPRRSPSGGTVDMGAYEWPRETLACAPALSAVNGTAPLQVTLTALVTGPDLAGLHYRWSFTNSAVVDVEGADKAVVTNTYGIGTWTVMLAVSNTAGQTASMTLTNALKVGALNAYVATNGPHVWPYTNWTMAASNIQAAVDVGALGSTVWVSNGLYLLTNTITVADGMTLRSANGLGTVTVHGQTNVRCFVVNHTNAVLDGLDIRRGRANYGAGAFLVAGLVDNCLITTNYGCPISVLYQGVLRNSSIVSNQSGALGNNGISGVGSVSFVKGSGQVDGGLVENCVIRDNAVSHFGPLFMTRATIRNTLIAGNRATAEGGDASGNNYRGARFPGCIVENCTITSNTVTTVGANISGVYADANTKFYNTIIYGNRTSTGAIAPTNYSFAVSPQVYHSLLEPAYAGAVSSLSGDPLLNPDFTLSAGSTCINQGTNLAWMTTTQTTGGGDYGLQKGSPCIEAGTNLAWTSEALDLAGNPRQQGKFVDIGAYEAPWSPPGTVFSIR